jgi:hypothetical protein
LSFAHLLDLFFSSFEYHEKSRRPGVIDPIESWREVEILKRQKASPEAACAGLANYQDAASFDAG